MPSTLKKKKGTPTVLTHHKHLLILLHLTAACPRPRRERTRRRRRKTRRRKKRKDRRKKRETGRKKGGKRKKERGKRSEQGKGNEKKRGRGKNDGWRRKGKKNGERPSLPALSDVLTARLKVLIRTHQVMYPPIIRIDGQAAINTIGLKVDILTIIIADEVAIKQVHENANEVGNDQVVLLTILPNKQK